MQRQNSVQHVCNLHIQVKRGSSLLKHFVHPAPGFLILLRQLWKHSRFFPMSYQSEQAIHKILLSITTEFRFATFRWFLPTAITIYETDISVFLVSWSMSSFCFFRCEKFLNVNAMLSISPVEFFVLYQIQRAN